MKAHSSSIAFIVAAVLACAVYTSAEPLATITGDVVTDFGIYKPVLVDVIPVVRPYSINEDFSNVTNFNDFELSEEAKALLRASGFACTASRYRQLYDIYNECESREIPAFVTTDACLHTYHILYDYMLRILEVRYFFDDLVNLTLAMIDASKTQYGTAADSSVQLAALDNIAYFSVALNLLDSTAAIDERIEEEVQEELAQIYTGSN